MENGELYTINDILDEEGSELDHIQVKKAFNSVATLARSAANSSVSLGLNASSANEKKKSVGFAIPASSPPKRQPKQAVHLTSSDGLIVVSAFLPVHLTRSDEGEWTADWDYEALLSMQTHLRVTRVGTVKWRGWHGNVGGGKSDESGVPVGERGKVEAVLRPFNCVPVWVPTTVFGEMYVK
jgi:trehalose 6-phosphate synthase/phosphatase